jgi:hypothetical protein
MKCPAIVTSVKGAQRHSVIEHARPLTHATMTRISAYQEDGSELGPRRGLMSRSRPDLPMCARYAGGLGFWDP